MIQRDVKDALWRLGMFRNPGAYVLVDGQFGSTGKGLMAHLLAEYDDAVTNKVSMVTTNAGPNSGHTAVLDNGVEIMTQQIPVFSVITKRLGRFVPTYLNAGAVIDPKILEDEIEKYGVLPYAHASSALITEATTNEFSKGSLDAIASTGKGVGQAMAARVLRRSSTVGTTKESLGKWAIGNLVGAPHWDPEATVFVETAQGFSLGIGSGFYPYTTSRECSVAQALADAGISPRRLRRTIMTCRVHPIRVGNTSMGNSGPGYADQKEITWEDVGQSPELTTVTKRVRRVFTWSNLQFEASIRVNEPDVVFLNFANYLKTDDEVNAHVERMNKVHREVFGSDIPLVLLGFGPRTGDIVSYEHFLAKGRPNA